MPFPAVVGATLPPAFTAPLLPSTLSSSSSSSAVFAEYEDALHLLHELDQRVSTLYSSLTDAALQSELYAFLRIKDDFVTRIKRRAHRKHHHAHVNATTSRSVPMRDTAGDEADEQVESMLTVEDLQALLVERAKAEGREVRVTVTDGARKGGRLSQWRSSTSSAPPIKPAAPVSAPPPLQSPKARLSAVLKDLAGEQPASEVADDTSTTPLSPVALPRVRLMGGAGRGKGKTVTVSTRGKPPVLKALPSVPRQVLAGAIEVQEVVKEGGAGGAGGSATARLKEETAELGLRLQQLAQQHAQLQDKHRQWEAQKTTPQDAAELPQAASLTQQQPAAQERTDEREVAAVQSTGDDISQLDDVIDAAAEPLSPPQTPPPILTSSPPVTCASPPSTRGVDVDSLPPSLPAQQSPPPATPSDPSAVTAADMLLTPRVTSAAPSPRDVIRQPIAELGNEEAQRGVVCAGLMLMPATPPLAETAVDEREAPAEMAVDTIEDGSSAGVGNAASTVEATAVRVEGDEAALPQPLPLDAVMQPLQPSHLLAHHTSTVQDVGTMCPSPLQPLRPLPSLPHAADSPPPSDLTHTLVTLRLTLRPSTAELEVHGPTPLLPSTSLPASPRTPSSSRRHLTQPPSPASRAHLSPSSRSRTSSYPTPSLPPCTHTDPALLPFEEDTFPTLKGAGTGGGSGGGGGSRRPSMGAVREAAMEAAVEAAEERIKKERWAAVMLELAARGIGRVGSGVGGEGREGGEEDGAWRRWKDDTAITASDLRRQMRLMGLTVDGQGQGEGAAAAQLDRTAGSGMGGEAVVVDGGAVTRMPDVARADESGGEGMGGEDRGRAAVLGGDVVSAAWSAPPICFI